MNFKGQVKVCPDCDSVDLRYRPNRGTRKRPGGERPTSGDWYCPHCDARFDHPDERERLAIGGRPPKALRNAR